MHRKKDCCSVQLITHPIIPSSSHHLITKMAIALLAIYSQQNMFA